MYRWTRRGKSNLNSWPSRSVYGHWTSHSLHWKHSSITFAVSESVISRTSPPCLLSMTEKRLGKLSQYLKQSRQPLQISNVRRISLSSASASQYFSSVGS